MPKSVRRQNRNTDTHTHTYTQDNYCNLHHACTRRVNKNQWRLRCGASNASLWQLTCKALNTWVDIRSKGPSPSVYQLRGYWQFDINKLTQASHGKLSNHLVCFETWVGQPVINWWPVYKLVKFIIGLQHIRYTYMLMQPTAMLLRDIIYAAAATRNWIVSLSV